MNKPHIVVLGAGYGGLMVVTRLQKLLSSSEATITLVNQNDYHYESTWLHEGAAGTLHHDRIRYPIANVINKHKVNFIKDTVQTIDQETKKVTLANGELTYDYLVFALGFESETFGIQGLKEHAFSIANINAVRKLREHIELEFATYRTVESHEHPLTLVVGGAGFTGIEFLGELANRVPQLCKEYDVPTEQVRIICVEAAPTVLPGFDPELVEYAMGVLQKKGVEFKIGTAIKEATAEGIHVAKGEETEFIPASIVVWAAGVRGSSVLEASGFEAMRGRVKVDEYLRAPNQEQVFIIGDSSLMINPENDRPFPPTAQIAMQQGETLAKNLASIIKGKNDKLMSFAFDNKGTVCSLGHDDAIGVVFGKKVTGSTASFMKKMVDNRALFMIGGTPLVLKKGKFNLF